ncbi:MAG: hypothetical protein WC665_04560 [Sulfurimonas sp.]|jgi:hypothetical protein
MNKLIILLSAVSLLGLVGCTTPKSDNSYYDRANKVSKEAINELDKE